MLFLCLGKKEESFIKKAGKKERKNEREKENKKERKKKEKECLLIQCKTTKGRRKTERNRKREISL